jgi:hypothetical protein
MATTWFNYFPRASWLREGQFQSLKPPINADETRMFSIGVNWRASAVPCLGGMRLAR